MDILESCKKYIQDRLSGIDFEDSQQIHDNEQPTPPPIREKDKNLDKILNQQAHLKRLIDQDNHIQMLKSSLTRVSIDVEELRKQCTKMNEEALRSRQELVETHAQDIDKYQMAQLRSIADDYDRNQNILGLRKNEIQSLKKEIEREERDREGYLADVEKKLEKKLQDRLKASRGGGLPFMTTLRNSDHGLTDELNNPAHIELASVDEYAPYGTAPHSRIRGGGRGSGRGRGGASTASTNAASATTGGRGRGRRRQG